MVTVFKIAHILKVGKITVSLSMNHHVSKGKCCKSIFIFLKELPTILKVADQLRIRGLATSTEKIAPRNDVLIGSKDEDEDEHRKIIVSTNHNKGRKGYLPKKIRTSGDRISDNSSPGRSLSDSGASPVPQRRNR